MALTIIRLVTFTGQDHRDLAKIWSTSSLVTLDVDDTHRVYAARFNERLLAAVRVTLQGTEGELDSLCVRDNTRRRGVGRYLVEEVIRTNPAITCWSIRDTGVEDRATMTAFAQALGFRTQHTGWVKTCSHSREAYQA